MAPGKNDVESGTNNNNSKPHELCPKPPSVFVRDATGLVRELSVFDSFIFNIVGSPSLGIFVLIVFAEGLWPSANLTASTVFGLVPALLLSFVYILFSIAMPRTGGDYVWVGRVIHPIVGFMVNFGITFILFTFIAIDVTIFSEWGLGAFFYGTGNFNWLGIISQPNVVFAISVALIVVVCAAVAFGARTAMRVQRTVWFFVLLAVLVYIGLAFFTGPSKFASNFNANSGTNVTSIMTNAVQQGFNPTVTVGGTLLGFVFMTLNFTGFLSTYVSGEVKNSRRSQTIGIVSAIFVFAALVIGIIEATEYTFGYNFFHALSYLFDEIFYGINPQAPYPTTLPPPFPQFLVGFLTSNPILIFIVTIGFAAAVLVNAVPYVYVCSRNLMAWSFDRAVPESLSKVDDRFHSPIWAILVTGILGVLLTYFSIYQSISALFTYTTLLTAIAYSLVGIAAVIFPLRRKDIFGVSTGIVKKRIGRFPLLSLLGVASIAAMVFLGYSILTPAYSGSFILTNFLLIVSVLVAPILIYAASYAYYKSRGVAVDLAQKELPPE